MKQQTERAYGPSKTGDQRCGAQEGKEQEHYGPAPDDLYGLAVSKDGNTVVTAGYGGNLRLYDVKSGKVKGFQLSEPKKKNMITYCITFTPDGKAVVTGHEFGNAAWVSYRLTEILPVPLIAKQKLLELTDSLARLAILQKFLEQQGLV